MCGGLGSEELDLGVRVIRLHEAGGVDLYPLQVDGLRPDLLPMQAVTNTPTHSSRALLTTTRSAPAQINKQLQLMRIDVLHVLHPFEK